MVERFKAGLPVELKVGDLADQGTRGGEEMKVYPMLLLGPGRGMGKLPEIRGVRRDMRDR